MKKVLLCLIISVLILSPMVQAKDIEYTEKQIELQQELAAQNYKFKAGYLHEAIKNGNNDIVKKYLDAGFSPSKTHMGWTNAAWAIYCNNVDALKLFIEYGANINEKSLGVYLLDTAINSSKKDAAKYLYENGAKYSSYNTEMLCKMLEISVVDIAQNRQKTQLLKSRDFYKFVENQYVFMPLTKEQISGLTDEEKLEYKLIAKANKKLEQARKSNSNYSIEYNYNEALRLNPDLDVAIFELGRFYHNNNNIERSQAYLSNYIERNPEHNVYHKKALGMITLNYYLRKNYDFALASGKQVYNLYDNKGLNNAEKIAIYDIIAQSAFKLTSEKYLKTEEHLYNTALQFANKNIPCDNQEFIINAHLIKYGVFTKQNKKALAYQEARNLLAYEQTTDNYIRLADCSPTEKEKLANYYNAKKYAKDNDELLTGIHLVADLEQTNLEKVVKKLGFYTKVPDWYEVVSLASKYGSVEYWSQRQDKFYNATNKCIKNYSGRNLSACFNQVLIDEEKATEALRFERALAQQEELADLQRMTNMHLSELGYQQRMSNYYQSQMVNYQKKILFGY